jgi:hypothetical protein
MATAVSNTGSAICAAVNQPILHLPLPNNIYNRFSSYNTFIIPTSYIYIERERERERIQYSGSTDRDQFGLPDPTE